MKGNHSIVTAGGNNDERNAFSLPIAIPVNTTPVPVTVEGGVYIDDEGGEGGNIDDSDTTIEPTKPSNKKLLCRDWACHEQSLHSKPHPASGRLAKALPASPADFVHLGEKN